MRPIPSFVLRCAIAAALGTLLFISLATTSNAAGVRDRGSDQALREKVAAITEANRQAFSAKSGRATLVVTSAADLPDDSIADGIFFPATLRSAIENANYLAGPDVITFDPALTQITLLTSLPAATGVLEIDGAVAGGARLVLDGGLIFNNPVGAEYGLFLSGGTYLIRHLEVRNFPDGGMTLTGGAPNSIIQDCLIHDNEGPGLNGNSLQGVLVGGALPGERNYIYGHTGSGGNGISFFEGGSLVGSNNCVIAGNYIGTLNGLSAGSNSRNGIRITGSFNTIAKNLIVANGYAGIQLGDDDQIPVLGNVIELNEIGLNAAGTDTLPNGTVTSGEGIRIEYSQGDTIRFNNISGNGGEGIEVAREAAFGLHIHDNNIGRDISLTAPLGNRGPGLVLRGHSHLVEHNAASANIGNGISCAADSSIVRGNVCGTEDPLDFGMGNIAVGLSIQGHENTIGGPNLVDRNIISGNNSGGIFFFGFSDNHNNWVEYNYIGVDSSGLQAIPNGGHGIGMGNGISGNTIIGNVIAASGLNGINVDCNVALPCNNNEIYGNIIGADVDTDIALPTQHGIFLSDANHTIIGGSEIAGNYIGGCSLSGVYIEFGDSNTINHNVIEGNGEVGVAVIAGIGNTIRFNSINDNGELGIDLNDDSVTPNDSLDVDAGPNNYLNFPVIDSVFVGIASSLVFGHLWAEPDADYVFDLYQQLTCDPSDYGEGSMWLDSASTLIGTDAHGYTPVFLALNYALDTLAASLSMTTTDLLGNTSEFSRCFSLQSIPDTADLRITKTADTDTVMVGDSIVYTVSVLNDGPDQSIGVVMIDSLPAGVTYVAHQVTLGGGTCTENAGVLNCALGTMPVSDMRTVEITAVAVGAGSSRNLAMAAGAAVDLDLSDNSDTAMVVVTTPTDVSELDPGLLPTEYSPLGQLSQSIQPEHDHRIRSPRGRLRSPARIRSPRARSTIAGRPAARRRDLPRRLERKVRTRRISCQRRLFLSPDRR